MRRSVVLAAGLILIASCSGEAEPPPVSDSANLPASEGLAPSDSTGPSTTASPSDVQEPSGAADPSAITWEASAFDGQTTEVIVDGETWVAVGRATERGPAAWTSSDARTWERAEVVDPQPDELFLGSGLGPTVRLGDSLLSYGTFIGCCDGRGVLGWRSSDGRSWEVIESASPLFERGYYVSGLAVGDAVLVAFETEYPVFADRLWRWTEETSWVDSTPGTAGTDDPSGIQIQDIVWADGRFVVVGMRHDPAESEAVIGVSLTSIDGETWDEAPLRPELEDVALFQVAPMPGGGFVALGIDDASNSLSAGHPVAFTSPDGLVWTPAEAPSADRSTWPNEILVVDGGLVAFGSTTVETLVWSSADGLSWTDAGRLDPGFVAGAARGDQLVVFTADYEDVATHFTIHRGTLGD